MRNTYIKLKNVISVMLTVMLLMITVFQVSIHAINQVWKFTFETGVNISNNEWCAKYGGTISTTNERSYGGNYSLMLEDRVYDWQSQALCLDRIFTEGGVGVYKISAWVCVKNIDPEGRKIVRSIIRGTYDNSFIDAANHEGTINYYTVLDRETTEDNEWIKLEGQITVNNKEINVGTYYWMLDVVDPYVNQKIYIDNVEILKVSDNAPTTLSNGANYKPYEKGYSYVDINSNLSEELKSSTYYYNIQNGYGLGNEYVITLNSAQYNDLCNELTALARDEYDAQRKEELKGTLKNAVFLFGQNNPKISLAGNVDSIVSSIDTIVNAGADDMVQIALKADSLYTEPNKLQENITYSLCFQKNTYKNFGLIKFLEYKFQASTGYSEWGDVNEDMQNFLIALSLKYQNGSGCVSVNKTYVEYSYGG